MNKPIAPDSQGSSTRPYLIRALHDWCTDNGFTPYVAVYVDASVQVPMEYVKNNEIVLNVGFEATTALKLGNEFIEFKARFGGHLCTRERARHGLPGAHGHRCRDSQPRRGRRPGRGHATARPAPGAHRCRDASAVGPERGRAAGAPAGAVEPEAVAETRQVARF
jgi:stringent starvation protein B